MILEIKFKIYNYWNNKVYKTKNNIPIIKLEDGYYILSDSNDIDSDPYCRLKDDCIKIVEEFSNEEE